jgi:hypothetical protein
MTAMLSWLGLYNTSEDVEWCNVNDLVDDFANSHGSPIDSQKIAKAIQRLASGNHFADSCAVAIGGDQISHFMQSAFRPGALTAYGRSRGQIFQYLHEAWQHFNEAFPNPNSMFRSIEGAYMEAKNISLFDTIIGGAIQQGIGADKEKTSVTNVGVPGAWLLDQKFHNEASSKFRQGQHQMGRALHTLQDAFSPAHALRDRSGRVLKEIYLYDKANLDAGPPTGPAGPPSDAAHTPGECGWPGHHAYDRSDDNVFLQNLALLASTEIITEMFENIHVEIGWFKRNIDNKLDRWLLQTSLKD